MRVTRLLKVVSQYVSRIKKLPCTISNDLLTMSSVCMAYTLRELLVGDSEVC